jgi:hypothetical protein
VGLFGGVVGRDEGRLASGSVELSKVKAPNVEGAAGITSFVALLSPHELRVYFVLIFECTTLMLDLYRTDVLLLKGLNCTTRPYIEYLPSTLFLPTND